MDNKQFPERDEEEEDDEEDIEKNATAGKE